MDTLSFGFLAHTDDSLGKAQAEFERREFAQALRTIAGLPGLFESRPDILQVKARSHAALGQHLEAVAAWEHLLRVDPDNKAARVELSRCYATMGAAEVFREVNAKFRAGKFADAIEALEAGPTEWRKHIEFHRLKALSHQRLSQHDRALDAWQQLAALAPGHADAYANIPLCLAAAGMEEEAESAFRAAAERFPENMFAQFNWLFFRLRKDQVPGGVALAIVEVERLRAVSGNSAGFKSQLDSFKTKLLALYDARELARHDPDNVLQLTASVSAAGQDLRSVYEQIEPVGNNCELGSVQRNHGAEPLSLFRWTSITPANLVRLLQDRLEDYEAPHRYRLEEGRESEFLLKEDAYQTASHTYLKTTDANAEALLERLARRQAFLKRKFLETAAEGRKIFVYKYDQRLDGPTMDAIQQGLAALGVRKFLFVMRAEGGDLPGSVRVETPDRVLGFLSDFMPNTQFQQWDSIVEQAHRHFI